MVGGGFLRGKDEHTHHPPLLSPHTLLLRLAPLSLRSGQSMSESSTQLPPQSWPLAPGADAQSLVICGHAKTPRA